MTDIPKEGSSTDDINNPEKDPVKKWKTYENRKHPQESHHPVLRPSSDSPISRYGRQRKPKIDEDYYDIEQLLNPKIKSHSHPPVITKTQQKKLDVTPVRSSETVDIDDFDANVSSDTELIKITTDPTDVSRVLKLVSSQSPTPFLTDFPSTHLLKPIKTYTNRRKRSRSFDETDLLKYPEELEGTFESDPETEDKTQRKTRKRGRKSTKIRVQTESSFETTITETKRRGRSPKKKIETTENPEDDSTKKKPTEKRSGRSVSPKKRTPKRIEFHVTGDSVLEPPSTLQNTEEIREKPDENIEKTKEIEAITKIETENTEKSEETETSREILEKSRKDETSRNTETSRKPEKSQIETLKDIEKSQKTESPKRTSRKTATSQKIDSPKTTKSPQRTESAQKTSQKSSPKINKPIDTSENIETSETIDASPLNIPEEKPKRGRSGKRSVLEVQSASTDSEGMAEDVPEQSLKTPRRGRSPKKKLEVPPEQRLRSPEGLLSPLRGAEEKSESTPEKKRRGRTPKKKIETVVPEGEVEGAGSLTETSTDIKDVTESVITSPTHTVVTSELSSQDEETVLEKPRRGRPPKIKTVEPEVVEKGDESLSEDTPKKSPERGRRGRRSWKKVVETSEVKESEICDSPRETLSETNKKVSGISEEEKTDIIKEKSVVDEEKSEISKDGKSEFGRNVDVTHEDTSESTNEDTPQKIVRKRGRPRRSAQKIIQAINKEEETEDDILQITLDDIPKITLLEGSKITTEEPRRNTRQAAQERLLEDEAKDVSETQNTDKRKKKDTVEIKNEDTLEMETEDVSEDKSESTQSRIIDEDSSKSSEGTPKLTSKIPDKNFKVEPKLTKEIEEILELFDESTEEITSNIQDESISAESPVKRRRGRVSKKEEGRRKLEEAKEMKSETEENLNSPQVVKKKRGRPPWKNVPPKSEDTSETVEDTNDVDEGINEDILVDKEKIIKEDKTAVEEVPETAKEDVKESTEEETVEIAKEDTAVKSPQRDVSPQKRGRGRRPWKNIPPEDTSSPTPKESVSLKSPVKGKRGRKPWKHLIATNKEDKNEDTSESITDVLKSSDEDTSRIPQDESRIDDENISKNTEENKSENIQNIESQPEVKVKRKRRTHAELLEEENRSIMMQLCGEVFDNSPQYPSKDEESSEIIPEHDKPKRGRSPKKRTEIDKVPHEENLEEIPPEVVKPKRGRSPKKKLVEPKQPIEDTIVTSEDTTKVQLSEETIEDETIKSVDKPKRGRSPKKKFKLKDGSGKTEDMARRSRSPRKKIDSVKINEEIPEKTEDIPQENQENIMKETDMSQEEISQKEEETSLGEEENSQKKEEMSRKEEEISRGDEERSQKEEETSQGKEKVEIIKEISQGKEETVLKIEETSQKIEKTVQKGRRGRTPKKKLESNLHSDEIQASTTEDIDQNIEEKTKSVLEESGKSSGRRRSKTPKKRTSKKLEENKKEEEDKSMKSEEDSASLKEESGESSRISRESMKNQEEILKVQKESIKNEEDSQTVQKESIKNEEESQRVRKELVEEEPESPKRRKGSTRKEKEWEESKKNKEESSRIQKESMENKEQSPGIQKESNENEGGSSKEQKESIENEEESLKIYKETIKNEEESQGIQKESSKSEEKSLGEQKELMINEEESSKVQKELRKNEEESRGIQKESPRSEGKSLGKRKEWLNDEEESSSLQKESMKNDEESASVQEESMKNQEESSSLQDPMNILRNSPMSIIKPEDLLTTTPKISSLDHFDIFEPIPEVPTKILQDDDSPIQSTSKDTNVDSSEIQRKSVLKTISSKKKITEEEKRDIVQFLVKSPKVSSSLSPGGIKVDSIFNKEDVIKTDIIKGKNVTSDTPKKSKIIILKNEVIKQADSIKKVLENIPPIDEYEEDKEISEITSKSPHIFTTPMIPSTSKIDSPDKDSYDSDATDSSIESPMYEKHVAVESPIFIRENKRSLAQKIVDFKLDPTKINLSMFGLKGQMNSPITEKELKVEIQKIITERNRKFDEEKKMVDMETQYDVEEDVVSSSTREKSSSPNEYDHLPIYTPMKKLTENKIDENSQDFDTNKPGKYDTSRSDPNELDEFGKYEPTETSRTDPNETSRSDPNETETTGKLDSIKKRKGRKPKDSIKSSPIKRSTRTVTKRLDITTTPRSKNSDDVIVTNKYKRRTLSYGEIKYDSEISSTDSPKILSDDESKTAPSRKPKITSKLSKVLLKSLGDVEVLSESSEIQVISSDSNQSPVPSKVLSKTPSKLLSSGGTKTLSKSPGGSKILKKSPKVLLKTPKGTKLLTKPPGGSGALLKSSERPKLVLKSRGRPKALKKSPGGSRLLSKTSEGPKGEKLRRKSKISPKTSTQLEQIEEPILLSDSNDSNQRGDDNSCLVISDDSSQKSDDLKITTPTEPHHDIDIKVGMLFWARVGWFPYWPCIIDYEPGTNLLRKPRPGKNFPTNYAYHVIFFGDNGKRSWVPRTHLFPFTSRNDLIERRKQLAKTPKTMRVTHHNHPSGFVVSGGQKYKWNTAVTEAESMMMCAVDERLETFKELLMDNAIESERNGESKRRVSREMETIKDDVVEDEVEKDTKKKGKIKPDAGKKGKLAKNEEKTKKSIEETEEIVVVEDEIEEIEEKSIAEKKLKEKPTEKKMKDAKKSDEKPKEKLSSDGKSKEKYSESKMKGKKRLSDEDTDQSDQSERKSKKRKLDPEDEKSKPLESKTRRSIQPNSSDEIKNDTEASEENPQAVIKRVSLFKGVPKVRVCQICYKPDKVYRCKGSCGGLYHVACERKSNGSRLSPNDFEETSNSTTDSNTDDLSVKNYPVDTKRKLSVSCSLSIAEQIDLKMQEVMKSLVDTTKYADSATESDSDIADDKSVVIIKHVTGDDVVQQKVFREGPIHYKCTNCQLGLLPSCFICGRTESKTGNEERMKCSAMHCTKYYHRECLKDWPQTKWSYNNNTEILTCPYHICHTCTSDDPRAPTSRLSNEKLTKCMRCPTTYHPSEYCVPAGSEIYSTTQIICPKHYHSKNKSKYLPHINASWCFICSMGGSLICCETCPASFHAECLKINLPEGGYICEECESGRLPLYNEVVWVKFGAYRWWPAQILYPTEIPKNVSAIKHNIGEFAVKFFGSHDHYWVNRGRVFLFQDGDSGHVSNKRNSVDTVFLTAITEAMTAHKTVQQERDSQTAEWRIGMKPPPYIKIKSNRPVGNVRTIDGDTSNTTPCDCDPRSKEPCGPDSDCLNRILLTECDPLVCAAGDRCCNQQFEKRKYAPVVPFRTNARGWGLKCLAPIKKGSFVIEYVGEIIDEHEYQKRIQRKHELKDENYYFLTIDKDRMIDAGPKGNVARFMNHSCSPNCETQKWTVNGDTRVGLFAIRDIPVGVELTFNYNLECIGEEKKICRCGAENCSGFIGVKVKQDEKKKPKTKKKTPVPEIITAETVQCFKCGEMGAEQICTNKNCTKHYHLKCIDEPDVRDKNWYCPRHNCKVCNKRTQRYCYLCTNAYCPMHSKGNIRYDETKFVCKKHDKIKKSKRYKKLSISSGGENVETKKPDENPEVTSENKSDKSEKKIIKTDIEIDTNVVINVDKKDSPGGKKKLGRPPKRKNIKKPDPPKMETIKNPPPSQVVSKKRKKRSQTTETTEMDMVEAAMLSSIPAETSQLQIVGSVPSPKPLTIDNDSVNSTDSSDIEPMTKKLKTSKINPKLIQRRSLRLKSPESISIVQPLRIDTLQHQDKFSSDSDMDNNIQFVKTKTNPKKLMLKRNSTDDDENSDNFELLGFGYGDGVVGKKNDENSDMDTNIEIVTCENKRVESEMDEKGSDIEMNDVPKSEVKSELAEKKAKVADMEAVVADLEAEAEDMEAKVADLEAAEAELVAKMADVEAKAAEMKAKEAKMETKSGELEDKSIDMEEKSDLKTKSGGLEEISDGMETKSGDLETSDMEEKTSDLETTSSGRPDLETTSSGRPKSFDTTQGRNSSDMETNSSRTTPKPSDMETKSSDKQKISIQSPETSVTLESSDMETKLSRTSPKPSDMNIKSSDKQKSSDTSSEASERLKSSGVEIKSARTSPKTPDMETKSSKASDMETKPSDVESEPSKTIQKPSDTETITPLKEISGLETSGVKQKKRRKSRKSLGDMERRTSGRTTRLSEMRMKAFEADTITTIEEKTPDVESSEKKEDNTSSTNIMTSQVQIKLSRMEFSGMDTKSSAVETPKGKTASKKSRKSLEMEATVPVASETGMESAMDTPTDMETPTVESSVTEAVVESRLSDSELKSSDVETNLSDTESKSSSKSKTKQSKTGFKSKTPKKPLTTNSPVIETEKIESKTKTPKPKSKFKSKASKGKSSEKESSDVDSEFEPKVLRKSPRKLIETTKPDPVKLDKKKKTKGKSKSPAKKKRKIETKDDPALSILMKKDTSYIYDDLNAIMSGSLSINVSESKDEKDEEDEMDEDIEKEDEDIEEDDERDDDMEDDDTERGDDMEGGGMERNDDERDDTGGDDRKEPDSNQGDTERGDDKNQDTMETDKDDNKSHDRIEDASGSSRMKRLTRGSVKIDEKSSVESEGADVSSQDEDLYVPEKNKKRFRNKLAKNNNEDASSQDESLERTVLIEKKIEAVVGRKKRGRKPKQVMEIQRTVPEMKGSEVQVPVLNNLEDQVPSKVIEKEQVLVGNSETQTSQNHRNEVLGTTELNLVSKSRRDEPVSRNLEDQILGENSERQGDAEIQSENHVGSKGIDIEENSKILPGQKVMNLEDRLLPEDLENHQHPGNSKEQQPLVNSESREDSDQSLKNFEENVQNIKQSEKIEKQSNLEPESSEILSENIEDASKNQEGQIGVSENPKDQKVIEDSEVQIVSENYTGQEVLENPLEQMILEDSKKQMSPENSKKQMLLENSKEQMLLENSKDQTTSRNPQGEIVLENPQNQSTSLENPKDEDEPQKTVENLEGTKTTKRKRGKKSESTPKSSETRNMRPRKSITSPVKKRYKTKNETKTLKEQEGTKLTDDSTKTKTDGSIEIDFLESKDKSSKSSKIEGTEAENMEAEMGASSVDNETEAEIENVSLSSRIKRTASPAGAKRTATPVGAKRISSPAGAKRTESPGRAKRTESPAGTKRISSPVGTKRTASPSTIKRISSPAEAKRTEPPAGTKRTSTPVGTKGTASPSTITRKSSPAGTKRTATPVGAKRTASPAEPKGRPKRTSSPAVVKDPASSAEIKRTEPKHPESLVEITKPLESPLERLKHSELPSETKTPKRRGKQKRTESPAEGSRHTRSSVRTGSPAEGIKRTRSLIERRSRTESPASRKSLVESPLDKIRRTESPIESSKRTESPTEGKKFPRSPSEIKRLLKLPLENIKRISRERSTTPTSPLESKNLSETLENATETPTDEETITKEIKTDQKERRKNRKDDLVMNETVAHGNASHETALQGNASHEIGYQEATSHGSVAQGMTSHRTASPGVASQGTTSRGTASHETGYQRTTSHGSASQGMTSHKTASQGVASQGTTSCGTASHETAFQGTASQSSDESKSNEIKTVISTPHVSTSHETLAESNIPKSASEEPSETVASDGQKTFSDTQGSSSKKSSTKINHKSEDVKPTEPDVVSTDLDEKPEKIVRKRGRPKKEVKDFEKENLNGSHAENEENQGRETRSKGRELKTKNLEVETRRQNETEEELKTIENLEETVEGPKKQIDDVPKFISGASADDPKKRNVKTKGELKQIVSSLIDAEKSGKTSPGRKRVRVVRRNDVENPKKRSKLKE